MWYVRKTDYVTFVLISFCFIDAELRNVTELSNEEHQSDAVFFQHRKRGNRRGRKSHLKKDCSDDIQPRRKIGELQR